MAHDEQMYFFQNVKHFFPRYFHQKKVLEIGALNVNGTVRVFFDDCDYTGIDIGPGACVDQVCQGEDFAGAAGEYDVIISTEVFEHTENWDKIFLNMVRLMKRDGIIIFTCAAFGRRQHGTRLSIPQAAPHVATTTDYYRNLSAKDFTDAFKFDHWFSNFALIDAGLFFVGIGKESTADIGMMEIFKQAYADYIYKMIVLGLPHEYIVSGGTHWPNT